MKKYYILFLLLCLAFQLNAQSTDIKRIIISEVMYDTPLNELTNNGTAYSNGEYVKLYNFGDTQLDLTRWELASGDDSQYFAFPTNTTIAPGGTLIIAYQYYGSNFKLQDLFEEFTPGNPQILYQSQFFLNNSGETIRLMDSGGKVIDYITYDGTSNPTKPNHLSAPNYDDVMYWDLVALHRTIVHFDINDCISFSPSHWKKALAAPELKPTVEVVYENVEQPVEIVDHIVETTHTSPTTGVDVITYYDKLGRPSQTVQVGASPEKQQDIVSFVQYDCMGRDDSVVYLPYVSASQSGSFRDNPLAEQQDFYKKSYYYTNSYYDENYAYARKEYDKSGLSITLKQGAVGKSFQLNEHPTSYQYDFNGPWGVVRRYTVTDSGDLVYLGAYADKQLTAKATIQPMTANEKSTTIEYFEPNGNLVALEQHISSQDRRITYYVYDDLGRLRYTIPPSVDVTANTSLSQLTDNCFYTEYDEYGRVSKQYVPGASYTLSLYDKRGRLALAQNGEQREAGKWSYTKYDNFDRPVKSGLITGGTSASHKSALESQTVFGESRIGFTREYTNRCYPTDTNEADVLMESYYDDYYWLPEGDHEEYQALHETMTPSPSDKPTTKVHGLLTGKKVKVLNSDTPQWLTSIIYYDKDQQVVMQIDDLYPQGREIVINTHDYTGNVTMSCVRQETPSGTYEYNKWFSYDQQGRLLTVDQQIAGDTENGRVTIASYVYDKLGRVSKKQLHNRAETYVHNYNIAGASTYRSSSVKTFGIESPFTNSGLSPRYDSKPVHFYWWNGDSVDANGYRYSYDATGQIVKAQYTQFTEDDGWFGREVFGETDIEYDKNGNITKMSRTDEHGDNLHNLSYTYKGNQLTKLSCNGVDYAGYLYDLCGNLTYDPVEQLNFEYNELNLPSRIFGSNGEIRYIYNAEGQKLATLAGGSFTYYRSVMVYGGVSGNSEQLLYMLQPEGTVVNENGRYAYKYHLTDYMGNVRAVSAFDKTSSGFVVEQMTDYYPFGLAHNYNNLHKNRYLFSGKELQDAAIGHSGFLGLYDFGARYYNPMLGRWFNPAPATQYTNPYLFCGNAPMAYIDKDGKFAWFIPLIGAAIGALSYTTSVALSPGGFDNWSWGSFGKFAAFGAVAGSISAGIGGAFGPVGSMGIGGELGRAFAHGVSSMTTNAAMGSNAPGADFFMGMGSSILGSATHNLSNFAQIGISSISAGIASELSGGDFWRGLGTGAIISGLNHVSHEAVDGARLKKHVVAAQEFLIAEGYNPEQVQEDITMHRNSIFTKNFAKFNNFDNYSKSFNDGYYDSYSKTHDAWLSKNTHRFGGPIRGTEYALKYYPSRASSVGIVRTGIMHSFEAGMTMLFNYDMHGSNSRGYLFDSGIVF